MNCRKAITAMLLWGAWWLVGGCVESFDPKVPANQANLLVVDGFINSRGITTIKLTRTVDLATKTAPPAETGATLRIEEENGPQLAVVETQRGVYRSAANTLNLNKRYRLYLQTTAGEIYTSDFMQAKLTPAIDQVYWQVTPDNELAIYADTHDEQSQTHYYRWNYEETWEFTSAFRTTLEYVGDARTGTIKENLALVALYRCWRSANSTLINLASTTRLSADVVKQQLITRVPNTSPKIKYGYSLLLKQYAQSQEEYDYWQLLKKNTEDIGSIYGTLPVQLMGNVHAASGTATDAIGFVGVYSEVQQRIFIDNAQLPRTWRPSDEVECNSFEYDTTEPKEYNVSIRPLLASKVLWPILEGSGVALTECVDCRLHGTNVRPSFWK